MSPNHSKDAEVWQEGGTSFGTTLNHRQLLAWVLGSCPQAGTLCPGDTPGEEASVKRAELGSPYRLPTCPLGRGIQRAEPGPQKSSPRKGSGVPASSWVPKAPRKRSMSLRLAWECRGTLHGHGHMPALVMHTHMQTEATAVSNLRPWPQLSSCHSWHSSLSPPSFKGFAITAQDGTYEYGIHTCVQMYKFLGLLQAPPGPLVSLKPYCAHHRYFQLPTPACKDYTGSCWF